ncbi:MAG: PAS domain S-box protein [Myxococcales bacterium]|nr:PAS domain S-box protein [Myxococcales bacterium]
MSLKSSGLESSPDSFLALSKRLNDAIIVCGADERIVSCNSKALNIWGLVQNEAVGRHFASLFVGQAFCPLANAVGQTIQAEGLHTDGSSFSVELTIASYLNVDTSVLYTILAVDHQSRSSVDQVLEQALDGVVTIDQQNIVTFMNSAAEKLWGYHREEVIGRNVKMLVPANIRAEHDEYINTNRITGRDKIVGISRDIELIKKNGQRLWVNLSLSKIRTGREITYTAFVKNINEERRAREIINQTLEQAVDGVVTIDQQNSVTFMNSAAEKMWGYSRDEVLGQNVKMLVPEDIRGHHDVYVNTNRETGIDKIIGTSRDVQLVRRDGQILWVNLSLSKISFGDEIYYTAFVKDISREHRAREIINQTLEQAVDGVVTIDQENQVTFMNKAAESLWGYRREEVVGKNVKMLVPSEIQTRHDDLVNANRRTGHDKIVGTSRDVEVTRRNGKSLWVNLSLSKIRIGHEVLYTAFIKDISNERRTREVINQTLEQAVDGVVTIDQQNNVTFMNSAAEKLWGYSRDEVLGQNVKMLVPEDIRGLHDVYVNTNRETGIDKIIGTSRDVQLVRRDGQILWVNLSLSKISFGDEIYYTAFVKDISREYRAREIINQTLEQAVDGVVTIDQENQVTFMNKAAESLWGYRREEVVGKNVKMLVPSEIQARHDDLVNANRRTGHDKIVGTSRDVKVTRRNGKSLWVNLSLSKIRIGHEVLYTAFIKDISGERRTQEVINQTLEQAIDAVVTIDHQNRVTFMNSAAEKLWGYNRDEVLGQNVKKLVPADVMKFHDQYIESNRKTGVDKIVGSTREVLLERKDRTRCWCVLALSKICLDDEIIYTAFVRDVHKEVESRSMNEILSLVANKTDNSVVITGADGRIEYVNAGFTRLTGYSLDEAKGHKPGHLLQGPKTDRKTVARIKESLRTRKPFYEEILNYSKTKKPYWISLAVNPVLNQDGELVRFVSIQADVTATKTTALRASACLGAVSQSYIMIEWDKRGACQTMNLDKFITNGALAAGDGIHMSELLNGEDRRAVLSGVYVKKEVRIGSVRAEGVFQPIANYLDEIDGVVFIGTDVTAERELVENSFALVESVLTSINNFALDISGIADQTRLLSLNATIEAAQAGAVGQGFKVVAAEVRSLAGVAARSANEIGALVDDARREISCIRDG